MISDLVAPAQRKPAFALSRLAVNLGMSVGPAIGGVLALFSFRMVVFRRRRYVDLGRHRDYAGALGHNAAETVA